MIVVFISEAIDEDTMMFAFYDTFYDRFVNLGDEQAWYSFEDFKEDYEELVGLDGLKRYAQLLPEWAFTAKRLMER